LALAPQVFSRFRRTKETKKMKKKALVALLVALSASGCTYRMTQGGPVPAGCCRHGDRLDVVMKPMSDPTKNDWRERCDRMGGKLVVEGDDVFVCRGVDF